MSQKKSYSCVKEKSAQPPGRKEKASIRGVPQIPQYDADIYGRYHRAYSLRPHCKYHRDFLHSGMHSDGHTGEKPVLTSQYHCAAGYEKVL